MPDDDLADAYVSILPDMDQFAAKLAADLEEATESMHPKVKVDIDGDDTDLKAKVAGATTKGDAFARGDFTATLGADNNPALAGVAAAAAAVKAFGMENAKATLGVDDSAVGRGISDALVKALTTAKTSAGAAAIAQAAGLSPPSRGGDSGLVPLSTGQKGKTKDGDKLVTVDALSEAFMGKEGGGFLSSLLSPLTLISSLFSAKFGSLGSLAGFGPEHLLVTGAGVAGSAAGAGAGAALLGSASLVTSGVGLATDYAGTGQALKDIKGVVGDVQALKTAIGTYGAASSQATAAQNTLNLAIQGIQPVARQSVVAAASMAEQIKSKFKSMTGEAVNVGAQIIQGVEGVAMAYVPMIAKYATENMKIIKKNIQPLFDWLKSAGGGMKDFTVFENVFQKGLPTAISAMTQGLKLFLNTMALIAPLTGGFMKAINSWFTKENTTGAAKFNQEILKLVALFRVWDAFAKILFKDIVDLFSKSAGLGEGIIQELTVYLTQLHGVLSSKIGNDTLSNFFLLHKKEFMQLIEALVEFGVAFTKAYLIAAPVMTQLATLFLKAATALMYLVEHIPGGGIALGFIFLAGKMGALLPLLTGVTSKGTLLERSFGLVGKGIRAVITDLGALVTGQAAAVGATEAESGATDALNLKMGALAGVGILAAAAGVYELIHTFGALHGSLIAAGIAVALFGLGLLAVRADFILTADSGIGKMIVGLESMVVRMGAALGAMIGLESATIGMKIALVGLTTVGLLAVAAGVYELVKHFGVLKGLMIAGATSIGVLIVAIVALGGVTAAFDAIPVVALVVAIGLAIVGLVAGIIFLITHWREVWKDVKDVVEDAVNFLKTKFGSLALVLLGPIAPLVYLALHWKQTWSDIKTWTGDALKFLESIPKKMEDLGKNIIEGLKKGILDNPIANVVKKIGSGLLGGFKSVLGIFSPSLPMINMGTLITAGLAQGMDSTSGKPIATAKEIAAKVLKAFSSLTSPKDLSELKSLSSALKDLNMVFSDLNKMVSNASKISTNVGAVTTAIGALAKAAPQMIGPIKEIYTQVKKLGDDSALTKTTKLFKNLGSTLGSVAEAISSSSKITKGGVSTLLGSLDQLAGAGKPIAAAIGYIVADFGGLDKTKGIATQLKTFDSIMGKVGATFNLMAATIKSGAKLGSAGLQSLLTDLQKFGTEAPQLATAISDLIADFQGLDETKQVSTDLKALKGVFTDLGSVFTSFQSITKQTSAQTATGIATMLADLNNFSAQSQGMVTAIKNIEKEFKHLGNLSALNSELSSVSSVITNLSKVFSALDSATKNSANASPANLKLVVNAVSGLTTALGNMNTSVSSTTVSALATVSKFSTNFQGVFTALDSEMKTIGANLMTGLANGITANGNLPVTAAHNVAAAVVTATKKVVKQNSPSLVFHEIGMGLMEGLANGITQGLSTHVLPALSTASNTMVKGFHPNLMATAGYAGYSSLTTGTPNSSTGSIGQTLVHYNPQYSISGTDTATVSKLQAMMNDHDVKLIDKLTARGGVRS